MRNWQTTTVRHGTQSGWTLHKELGERPCDPCYQAKQAYDIRWRAAPERTRRNRRYAACQMRAYQALAHRYPNEYRALYRQFNAEAIAAEAQGVAS